MIPIIYPSNETQFQNNGLGRLPDCISCRVTEERNGVFELELVYPITGHNYDLIQIGRIIYTTHDATKTPQPFDIYKRSVPIDGHVTFSAHHISYRLNGMVVTPFTVTGAAGAALAALGSHSITSCPFTFSSDRTTSLTYTVSKPDTIRRLLGGVEGSILDVYGGGDYTFNKFNVTFGTRGTDNGVTIRYGKQMTDIDAEHSTEGTYNAVVPFWSNETEMVTLPEWYVSNGTPETLAVLDLSSEWQEAPAVADLRAKAQDRLAKGKPWEPDENIEVSFVVQPEDYEGIENLQRVVLCDTVTVAYPAAGVSAKIRVIKTEYNPLTERYISVELGTPQTSLAQTITEKAVSDTLKNTITAGFMTQAIQTATDLIAGGLGGHVVIGRNADGEPEEILIMDTDDTQTAVNVIRMNRAGIGFSTDGYDGPFTSAWTIDGTFNTAFIQVNALSVLSANAGTITAGVLQSEDYSPPASGSDYASDGMIIDLDNEVVRMQNTAILADGSLHTKLGDVGGWTIASNGLYRSFTAIYPGTTSERTYEVGFKINTDPNDNFLYTKRLWPDAPQSFLQELDMFHVNNMGDMLGRGRMQWSGAAYFGLGTETFFQNLGHTAIEDGVVTIVGPSAGGGILAFSYGGGGTSTTIQETSAGVLTASAPLISNATDTSERYFRAINANGSIELNASAGNKGIYDRSGGRWIIYLDTNSTAETVLRIPRGVHIGTPDINGYLELYHATPYIDFHFGRSTADYTTRLWESSSGSLACTGYFSAKLYNGSSAQVVGSNSTDGNRVALFAAPGATTFQIGAQWGGSTYSTKNVTVSSSDKRLKENIKDTKVEALPIINQIKVREFDWKDGKHQKIGVVADELEEIDERLAVGGGYDEDGNMNVKSVDTFYLVGYLVKAVQELSDEVERLKRELGR